MRWLRQSTSQTIVIGPFVDDTDGKTPETALVINAADIRLSKNGAAFGASSNGATHMEEGYYTTTLSTANSNTLGALTLRVNVAGALPLRLDYIVVPANVYDSIVSGTDNLDVESIALTQAAVGNILNGDGTMVPRDILNRLHASLINRKVVVRNTGNNTATVTLYAADNTTPWITWTTSETGTTFDHSAGTIS